MNIPESQRGGDDEQGCRQRSPRKITFAGIRLSEAAGGKSGGLVRRVVILLSVNRAKKVGRRAIFYLPGFAIRILITSSAIFDSAIFISAIFISALGAEAAVCGAGIVIGGNYAGASMSAAVIFQRFMSRMMKRFGWNGMGFASAEVGKNWLGLDLTLVQGGEIIGNGFFFIEANLAGVGADEPFVENAAGELLEFFFFQGAQHAGADFGGARNGFERDATLFALLP